MLEKICLIPVTMTVHGQLRCTNFLFRYEVALTIESGPCLLSHAVGLGLSEPNPTVKVH